MKNTRRRSVFFGISLAVFCILLIAASVRIGLVQSRQQSLRYQTQMILKEHVEIFAKDLSIFAHNYKSNTYNIQDTEDLHDIYIPGMNDYAKQLKTEGIQSTNLQTYFEESKNHGITKELLGKISIEMSKMAKQLPTPYKTIENKADNEHK